MKPDKLPTIDIESRGIFDRIIATAVQVRKDRRSDEYRQLQQRELKAAEALRRLKELEAKAEEDRKREEERHLAATTSFAKVFERASDGQ